MNRRKKQIEDAQNATRRIEEILKDIDSILSGIHDVISMPLYNLIHIESRLGIQMEDDRIHELCMKIQSAVDGLSDYTYSQTSEEDLTRARNDLFTSVNDNISEPLHEVIRMVRQIACTTTDEDIRKDAGMMEAYASLAEFSIGNIFDEVKIQAGEFSPNDRRFHLSELISDVTFIAGYLSEIRELSFECISDLDTPEFWVGDDIRVRHALTDIINNSIKNTTEGLVRLYVSHNNNGGLTFVISDTGRGTDDIYQEYYGTVITESLGGTVKVESVRDRGSEFIISLPLHEGRQIADADGLLDTQAGLSYYDEDLTEYRNVLLLFYDMAPSYRDSILNDSENAYAVMKSLYNAATSIGAKVLSRRLYSAMNNGSTGDDFNEIFDETMYRVSGYAGRR